MMPKRKASTSRSEEFSTGLTIKKKKKKGASSKKEVSKKDSDEMGELKSRIREMGPICRSRLREKEVVRTSDEGVIKDDDIDEIEVEGEDEGLWLSSQSLSPLYKFPDFRFMSPREYSLDDRLISLLSSSVNCKLFPDHHGRKGNNYYFFDGCRDNPIKEAFLTLKEEDGYDDDDDNEGALLLVGDEEDSNQNCNDVEVVAGSKLSLINLEGDGDDDSKWISSFELDVVDDLESSDFPSPSFKSMMKQGQTSKKQIVYDFNGFASEVLFYSVRSMDLDVVDFDEPLSWPFKNNNDWRKLVVSNDVASSSVSLRLDQRRIRRSKMLNNYYCIRRRSTTAPKTMKFKHNSGTTSRKNNKKKNKDMLIDILPLLSKQSAEFEGGTNGMMVTSSSCDLSSVGSSYGFSIIPGNSSSSSSATTSQTTHSASSSMDFDETELWVSLNVNLFPAEDHNNQLTNSKNCDQVLLAAADQINMDVDQAQDPGNWNIAFDWDGFCLSPPRTSKYSSPFQSTYLWRRPTNPSISINKLSSRSRPPPPQVVVLGSNNKLLSPLKFTEFKQYSRRRSTSTDDSIRKLNNNKSVVRRRKRGATEGEMLQNAARMADAVMENFINVDHHQDLMMMGLREFDGHEGINTEFDNEAFSLTQGI